MNVDNLNKLADWLDAGAPHILFDMNFAHVIDLHPDDIIIEHTGIEDFSEYLEVTNQTGKGDCGSVCCIAGAAMLMSEAGPDEVFPSLDRQHQITNRNLEWVHVRDKALEFLGLEIEKDLSMGHSLFDPNHAPENCTPQEAAEAVRRVIAGEEPWT